MNDYAELRRLLAAALHEKNGTGPLAAYEFRMNEFRDAAALAVPVLLDDAWADNEALQVTGLLLRQVEAERDALEAENTTLKAEIDHHVDMRVTERAERDAALAEMERLRQEVERHGEHTAEECDQWYECPCYVEGREQGQESAGARG